MDNKTNNTNFNSSQKLFSFFFPFRGKCPKDDRGGRLGGAFSFGGFRGLGFGFLFLLLLVSPLSAQNLWTLEQCVDTALANNRNVKQQDLSRQSKEIAYNQARQNLLPNLNASAGQNYSFGRSLNNDNVYESANSSQTTFSLSANLTLFDGLRLKNNIDLQRTEMYASEADLEKIKSDIVMSVTTAFLQVLMNKEMLQTAEEQLLLTQARIKQQKSLVENGKLAEGELYELLAQEAKEELNRIQAENSLKLSLLDLAQILELEDFRNLDVSTPDNLNVDDLALLSDELIFQNALISRPEIKGAEYRMKMSEKNVSIVRAGYSPTLSLGSSLGTAYRDIQGFSLNPFSDQLSDNMSTSIGLNLSIPIFNRFSVRNNVKNAQLNVENSKLVLENTKLELRKTIQQAHQNALAAKSRWSAAGKSEKAAQEAYRFVNQKHEAGRATQYELFQAKNNLAQVLSEQTQAKFEYIFRVKILEILNGKMN